jgi:hypothetical protein
MSLSCIDLMMLRLFWLGEAKRPGLFPRFYHVDYAPSILRFLCRPEGACGGASELDGDG